jgi:hypothetical protein
MIVCNALGINLTVAARNDTCPGDGKTKLLKSHFRHKSDILSETVIVIGADLPVAVPRDYGLTVLNGRALAVFIPCAFALICRRASSPEEILGEGL